MALKSWVASANDPATDFPLENLPYGVFRYAHSTHIGVAIGDRIFDLGACASGASSSHCPAKSSTPVRLSCSIRSCLLGRKRGRRCAVSCNAFLPRIRPINNSKAASHPCWFPCVTRKCNSPRTSEG